MADLNKPVGSMEAVAYALSEIMEHHPTHKSYLKQFPEGKDFVFDVVENIIKSGQTRAEFAHALSLAQADIGKTLSRKLH
jgi:hypothetical protein|tara:strand:+ start:2096 stop:2335 length:240 start_codon:yes stop_codon:yes gene_type:complete